MSISTISAEGRLYTNECAPITEPIAGDDGLAEVEKSDENEITLHLRHYADTQACLSFSMTRANAITLSEALRAAVADG